MSSTRRPVIPIAAAPCWEHPSGARPFVFRSPQPLMAAAPWVVRYGVDGARCFPTSDAAVEWATRHYRQLARGVKPETGEKA